MEREEAKHRQRVAKLEVIRAKLTEKGNAEAAARVGEVLEKENDRYARAMERLRRQNEQAAQRFQQKMQRLAEREAARQKGPAGQRSRGNGGKGQDDAGEKGAGGNRPTRGNGDREVKKTTEDEG